MGDQESFAARVEQPYASKIDIEDHFLALREGMTESDREKRSCYVS